jgi:DNA invertase Pin-like site-specific DNA recombinase
MASRMAMRIQKRGFGPRERGRRGGRPKVLSEKKVDMARALYADKRHTITEICKTLNISKTSLYRYLKA